MNLNMIYVLILLAIIILVIIIIKNIKKLRSSKDTIFSKEMLEELQELNKQYKEVYLDLFKSNVELVVEENVDEKYVEKCVSHLNNLKDSVIDEICKKLLGYYVFMLEVIKESEDYETLNEIKDQMPEKLIGREILQGVKPFTLIIKQPKEDIPAYTLYCDCVWEQEHGVWLIFKENNILYCGDICEIGPWENKKEYQKALGLGEQYFTDYKLVLKKLKDINNEK